MVTSGSQVSSSLSGKRAIVRENQIRGHEAWIEDEHGQEIDSESFQQNKAGRSKYRETLLAILTWTISLLVLIGGLYWLGLWIDGDL